MLIDINTIPDMGDNILDAYIDDSTNGDLTCSGGYLFEPDTSQEFREVWRPFLIERGMLRKREPFFRAADCLRQRKDHAEIFAFLAELIKRTAMRGMLAVASKNYLSETHESVRPRIGSAFSSSTLACMEAMAEIAKEKGKLVVYFIEDSNEYGGELRCFLKQIKEQPGEMERFAMVGAHTYDKRLVIQLHAADFFAWAFGRSYYMGGWTREMNLLAKDGVLRHSYCGVNVDIAPIINAFRGLQSNRKVFGYEKKRDRGSEI